MYLSSTPSAELWPDTLKGSLRAIAVAAVFWALAATLLYLLSPGLDTWPRLLVFHECVGMTMVACVLMLRRTRAFTRFQPHGEFVLPDSGYGHVANGVRGHSQVVEDQTGSGGELASH